jgi:Amt family ammonium transporter
MHIIPGLRLRVSEETEILGIDDSEMGEFAYDYVGVEQEIQTYPHPHPSVDGTELGHRPYTKERGSSQTEHMELTERR